MQRRTKQPRKTQELTRALERDALVAYVEMKVATGDIEQVIQQYKL